MGQGSFPYLDETGKYSIAFDLGGLDDKRVTHKVISECGCGFHRDKDLAITGDYQTFSLVIVSTGQLRNVPC